jgi:hypothetical protein
MREKISFFCPIGHFPDSREFGQLGVAVSVDIPTMGSQHRSSITGAATMEIPTMKNSSLATQALHTLTAQEAHALVKAGQLVLVVHMPSLGAHAGEMRISLSNGHRVVKSVPLHRVSKPTPQPAPVSTPSSTDNVVVVAQTASPAPRKPKARKGYKWQEFVGLARKHGLSMGDAAKLWNGELGCNGKGRTVCEETIKDAAKPAQSKTVHVKETPTPRLPASAPPVTTDVDKRTNKRAARKAAQDADVTSMQANVDANSKGIAANAESLAIIIRLLS